MRKALLALVYNAVPLRVAVLVCIAVSLCVAVLVCFGPVAVPALAAGAAYNPEAVRLNNRGVALWGNLVVSHTLDGGLVRADWDS